MDHLEHLPSDLQMYILSKRSDLLLLAPRLSKLFYQRAQPYLYQRFHSKPISYRELANYLITYKIPKWGYIETDSGYNASWLLDMTKDEEGYRRHYNSTLYFNGRIRHPGPNDRDHIGWKRFLEDRETISTCSYIDFRTMEKILLKRKRCLDQNKNYVKEYLLNYLVYLRTRIPIKTKQMEFYMYLILNLRVYQLKTTLPAQIDNIKLEIEKEYPRLVDYLQQN